MFSPCVWGWSVIDIPLAQIEEVFPMRVGMVRNVNDVYCYDVGFPHACGDGPKTNAGYCFIHSFSPCVWGWSAEIAVLIEIGKVFPMRVGMVRSNISE